MSEYSQSARTQQKPRKAKVKTGCRTCKIRRVKCDEGRPACTRCVSTGRVCDGYGIWGGGGTPSNPRNRPATVTSESRCGFVAKGAKGYDLRAFLPVIFTAGALNTDEYGSLEWFAERTVTKLPGAFGSSFWGKLVLQASSSEAAVMYAVLALGSVHRTVCSRSSHRISGLMIDEGTSATQRLRPRPLFGDNEIPDEQERFALLRYSKAIGHLQPHLSARSRASVRVALIACVLFTCLEFLRGHYRSGNAHLQNGVRLLTHLYRKGAPSTGPSTDPMDDWLIETFTRLNLQAALFGQSNLWFPPGFEFRSPALPVTFATMNHARETLDRLLIQSVCLEEQSQSLSRDMGPPRPGLRQRLLASQERIQTCLARWLRICTTSQSHIQTRLGPLGPAAYQLLHLFHTMATVMAATCLRTLTHNTTSIPVSGGPESIYDDHTPSFLSIIANSLQLSRTVLSIALSKALPDPGSSFVADIGWIPPLYYTALKCRVHRLRAQAVRIMASLPGKEGIWDALLAAEALDEVIRIEEGGFYLQGDGGENNSLRGEDDFSCAEVPSLEELRASGLPVLPEERRLSDVRVMLPDGPGECMGLVCKRSRAGEGGGEEVIGREFDAALGAWVDIEIGG